MAKKTKINLDSRVSTGTIIKNIRSQVKKLIEDFDMDYGSIVVKLNLMVYDLIREKEDSKIRSVRKALKLDTRSKHGPPKGRLKKTSVRELFK